MSRTGSNRKRAKLKALTGIRARLVLLALILVVPLMAERVRSLENTRAKTIAEINHEFDKLGFGHAICRNRRDKPAAP